MSYNRLVEVDKEGEMVGKSAEPQKNTNKIERVLSRNASI